MIKREIFKELVKHSDKPEISLITGPRQAGKTTLMLLLKEHLDKQGKKTLFFNLDIENDYRFFSSQQMLINKIELEIGKNKGYIFIDEIQRKENAGVFLKGLYDLNLPYKFIVSGSGSLQLKEKIHESLSGRKRVFSLSTVSFREFVNYKTDYRYENKLTDFFVLEKEKTEHLLNEYLSFGGYPQVVLAEEKQEKIKILEEIYQSYLLKDISYLLGVEKKEAFSGLVKILASQAGQLLNYTELANTLNLSLPTVKNYLWYLENTYILKLISPYFRNIRKEITKAPICYFSDLGMKNYVLGQFDNPGSGGLLFQNFVFQLLENNFDLKTENLKFWRTKEGAEVDFILEKGTATVPYEIKYSHLKEAKISRSFRAFLAKYQSEQVFVVNLSLLEKTEMGITKVFFVPYFYLLTDSPINLKESENKFADIKKKYGEEK
ncbi:MAG: ATP-binding protein [bacterium]